MSRRAEWAVAWRFARDLYANRKDELTLIEAARAALGRPVPRAAMGAALHALWTRDHEQDELHAIRCRAARRTGFYRPPRAYRPA
jgi:hypothetical protein